MGDMLTTRWGLVVLGSLLVLASELPGAARRAGGMSLRVALGECAAVAAVAAAAGVAWGA